MILTVFYFTTMTKYFKLIIFNIFLCKIYFLKVFCCIRMIKLLNEGVLNYKTFLLYYISVSFGGGGEKEKKEKIHFIT